MLKPRRGITLIESLVAIVVLALGVLTILGLQMRTLADAQTSLRRAQAVRLLEDLSERIRMGPRGLSELASYTSDWGAALDLSDNCAARACSSAELARYDKNLWLGMLRQSLPLGDAAVFLAPDETDAGNRRQLGVMISWRTGATASGQAALQPASTGAAAITCPPDRSCHLQYLQPGARCLPYAAGGARLAICLD